MYEYHDMNLLVLDSVIAPIHYSRYMMLPVNWRTPGNRNNKNIQYDEDIGDGIEEYDNNSSTTGGYLKKVKKKRTSICKGIPGKKKSGKKKPGKKRASKKKSGKKKSRKKRTVVYNGASKK